MKRQIYTIFIVTAVLLSFIFFAFHSARAFNSKCTDPSAYKISSSSSGPYSRADAIVSINSEFSWNNSAAQVCLDTPVSFQLDYKDKKGDWQEIIHSGATIVSAGRQIKRDDRISLQSLDLAELKKGARIDFRLQIVDYSSGLSTCITGCTIASKPEQFSIYITDDPVIVPPVKKFSCNTAKVCVEDSKGTYTTSNCDKQCTSGGGGVPTPTATSGGGPGGPGTTSSGKFDIKNPIAADDFGALINIIAKWIFNLAIPVAIIMIIYAGIKMIMAQGNSTKFTEARKILTYAIGGLVVIFIGKGFISLIKSILSLGS